ncbi:protein of unknown function [Burkholderia multivorans]
MFNIYSPARKFKGWRFLIKISNINIVGQCGIFDAIDPCKSPLLEILK